MQFCSSFAMQVNGRVFFMEYAFLQYLYLQFKFQNAVF